MDDQEEIEAETAREVEEIKKDYETNKDNVIDYLINNVMDVNLDIPKVVRGDFESA